MSENKKYYYMKLKENFFTSERMVVLETMPDGILYSNLLLKMYLMSLKHNGVLLLHENLPHTPQTIATFTRHQIGTVERALQIFLKLGFVELLTDGTYYMPDIQLLVGRSSTEAERKRRERLRLQAQKLLSNSKADICPPENRDKEIRDKSLDKDTDIEDTEDSCAEPETVSAPPIISIILNDKTFFDVFSEDYNRWCELYPAVNVMQELRKMSSWSTDNPKRRKTKSGIRRFINAWLSKEQDKGGQYRYQGSGSSGNVFTDIAEGMRNGQA